MEATNSALLECKTLREISNIILAKLGYVKVLTGSIAYCQYVNSKFPKSGILFSSDELNEPITVVKKLMRYEEHKANEDIKANLIQIVESTSEIHNILKKQA